MIVCKRTAGSGTQAAINDFFFGFPCSSSFVSPAAAQAATTGGVVSGYTVIENSSSGALATCMTAAVQGTSSWLHDQHHQRHDRCIPLLIATQGSHCPAGGRAIGLMGLDRARRYNVECRHHGYGGTTKLPELYTPISINGAVPTVLNAALGNYDVVVNNSWNKRATYRWSGIAPLAGSQLALFNAMASKSGDPAILGTTKVPASSWRCCLVECDNSELRRRHEC